MKGGEEEERERKEERREREKRECTTGMHDGNI